MEYEILLYDTDTGKCPFNIWLRELKDISAKAKIRLRIERLALGNFGDCKHVGDGVRELRLHIGPGYRIYFAIIGTSCVLLLQGGAKQSQASDIKKAKKYLLAYKKNQEIGYATKT